MKKLLSNEKTVKAMVSSWRRIDDDVIPPRIKCAANYQNSRLALTEANMNGYDTSIILNKNGKVAKEARACIFIVRDKIPVTPPVTSGILDSITRKTIIDLFKDELSIETIVRDVDRTELYIAEEAFFCGSGAEITSINFIDDYQIKSSEISKKIETIYMDIVHGNNEKYKNWLTEVY